MCAQCNVPNAFSRGSCCSCLRHKRLLLFLTALVLIVSGHLVAIYFIHFKERWTCNPEEGNCVPDFKVLSFNTWGMPERLGSQDKAERMKAIAEELNKGITGGRLFFFMRNPVPQNPPQKT